LLVGEVGGDMPDGFDLHNSPAAIATRTDIHRPMILVSTSGTRLIVESEGAKAVYVAPCRAPLDGRAPRGRVAGGVPR
jgi:2-phosphosulfolactate phosphatase